jgi:secretion/DNA translocation related TadE-like protein
VTAPVLAVSVLLVVVTVVAVAGGRLLVAQRRAGSAADLGALAGAVAAQRGGEPCAAVRRLVALHDARVTRCWVAGKRVRVVVSYDVGVLVGREVSVAARAQAGPR